MEHIAALLLIIGCSDDLRNCTEIPAPVALYETVEDCDAVLSGFRSVAEGTSPRVFATCVDVDPALAEEDLELTWDVTEANGLSASIGVPELQVASTQYRPEKDYLSQE